MTSTLLSQKAEKYLHKLCLEIPGRRVGSSGNRTATEFFAGLVTSFGFQTECPKFDCIDWSHGDVQLMVDGEPFKAFVSPYSLGCQVSAPLTVVSTVEELEAVETSSKIILLRGDIAKEQLMPKNFTFYNPDQHRRIINLLEAKGPPAIIAATSRNPELAGGVYPFPLIEDGDFDIPSVYMTEKEGEKLAKYAGKQVSLEMQASRSPATGCNVIARNYLPGSSGSSPGKDNSRIVFCAHIDAKEGSPGALDNATGVVTLLLLAELLKDYSGHLGFEIVALNGEDYYAAPGEVQYLNLNTGRLAEIGLAINLDGAGYYQGQTAYSLYDCPAEMADSIRTVFSAQPDMVEGDSWYQSDHSIFIMNQRPALAITSGCLMELSTYITHTAKDGPELVDCHKLANIALALRDLLLDLDRLWS